MKLFKSLKFYITRNNYKSRWEVAKIINCGFADEITRLEKELSKYKQPRSKDGRFVSKKKTMTDLLKQERAERYIEQVPDWGDLKNAYKMGGFGR